MKIRITSLLVTALVASVCADNPIITDEFTADPAPLVYKNKVYLYENEDGTMKRVIQTSEGVERAK